VPTEPSVDGRPTLPVTRAVLVAFACLTALAVASLYVMAGETDRLFAWTIAPPLTAAFLGAGYAAGWVLVVLSLRERSWARNRVPVVTVLVFTTITAWATFAHLDKLHFDDAGALATFAAWLWTAIYVVVPLSLVAVVVVQERLPGEDPPRRQPVPGLLRGLLGVQSVVMLVVGLPLLVAPGTADELWPWPLTPFTARVVAAWLLSLGLATGFAALRGDLDHLRTATVPYGVFGLAVLGAVLRYRDAVAWDRAAAWLLVGLMACVALTGLAGARVSRRRAAAPGRHVLVA
jgi:hypothetical protein